MVKIKCCRCKRNIASGAEAQKAIVEYRQADGGDKVFGYMMSDGPLSAATGQILRGYHSKCYWIERKREHKGDAVTGRVMGAAPTGYDISTNTSTRYLSERLDQLRAISRQVGKPVGDPYVTEAFRAQENGGPYRHEHHFKLDTYQLMAHLRYAHGFDDRGVRVNTSLALQHDSLHATAALADTDEQRRQDPGHIEPPERDWRDQTVIDI